jgi:hypothetical protein
MKPGAQTSVKPNWGGGGGGRGEKTQNGYCLQQKIKFYIKNKLRKILSIL